MPLTTATMRPSISPIRYHLAHPTAIRAWESQPYCPLSTLNQPFSPHKVGRSAPELQAQSPKPQPAAPYVAAPTPPPPCNEHRSAPWAASPDVLTWLFDTAGHMPLVAAKDEAYFFGLLEAAQAEVHLSNKNKAHTEPGGIIDLPGVALQRTATLPPETWAPRLCATKPSAKTKGARQSGCRPVVATPQQKRDFAKRARAYLVGPPRYRHNQLQALVALCEGRTHKDTKELFSVSISTTAKNLKHLALLGPDELLKQFFDWPAVAERGDKSPDSRNIR